MSRSYKKTSINGIVRTASSEKVWKRLWNRIFRRTAKQAILQEEEPPIDLREVSEVWDGSKDGKKFFDEEEHPELMRK